MDKNLFQCLCNKRSCAGFEGAAENFNGKYALELVPPCFDFFVGFVGTNNVESVEKNVHHSRLDFTRFRQRDKTRRDSKVCEREIVAYDISYHSSKEPRKHVCISKWNIPCILEWFRLREMNAVILETPSIYTFLIFYRFPRIRFLILYNSPRHQASLCIIITQKVQ